MKHSFTADFIPGDLVYHRVSNAKGMVVAVGFHADGATTYQVEWSHERASWHPATLLAVEPCPSWELRDGES